jgi:hypothetical protein
MIPSVHPAVSSLGASPTPAHRHRHILISLRVGAGIGQPLTFAVIGKEWKLTFSSSPRQAKAAFHEPESSFLPERRVSCQVRPLAAPNGATAPGQDPPLRIFFHCGHSLSRSLGSGH